MQLKGVEAQIKGQNELMLLGFYGSINKIMFQAIGLTLSYRNSSISVKKRSECTVCVLVDILS